MATGADGSISGIKKRTIRNERNQKRNVLRLFLTKLDAASTSRDRSGQWNLIHSDLRGLRTMIAVVTKGIREAQLSTGQPLFSLNPENKPFGPVALRELQETLSWMLRRSLQLYKALEKSPQIKAAHGTESYKETRAFFDLRIGDIWRYMAENDVTKRSFYLSQAIKRYKRASTRFPISGAQSMSRILHESNSFDLAFLFKLRAVALDKLDQSRNRDERRAATKAAIEIRELFLKRSNVGSKAPTPFDSFLAHLTVAIQGQSSDQGGHEVILFDDSTNLYEIKGAVADERNEMNKNNKKAEPPLLTREANIDYWSILIVAFAILASLTMEKSAWMYCHRVIQANPEIKRMGRWLYEHLQRQNADIPRNLRANRVPLIVYSLTSVDFPRVYRLVQSSPFPTGMDMPSGPSLLHQNGNKI